MISKAYTDWRRLAIKDICTKCDYYGYCHMELDCKALQILVKIYENLDNGNPDQ